MTLITYFEALFLKEIEFQKAAIVVDHPETGAIVILGESYTRDEEAFKSLDKFSKYELIDIVKAGENDAPMLYAASVSDKGLEELKKFSLYPIKQAMPKKAKLWKNPPPAY